MRVGLVVEGDGDVQAFPVLISRLGLALGIQAYAPQPVRAGGHCRLARPGELERFTKMAASQPGTELVIVAVDCDDACAVDLRQSFDPRLAPIAAQYGIPIHLALCVKEYEAWMLDSVQHLAASAPEYEWLPGEEIPNAPEIRGAKERLQSRFRKHYKEITDQARLTRHLNIAELYKKNRSFRRFVKAFSGLEYDLLDDHFAFA